MRFAAFAYITPATIAAAPCCSTLWKLTACLWAAGTVKRIMTQPIVREQPSALDSIKPSGISLQGVAPHATKGTEKTCVFGRRT